jgi:UDP-4-amino-4-deoxy-L-arabinose-oxoglutarate aminotransferase
MVDIEALRGVCGPDIAIIEDCAHCFEGRLNGHRPGAFSDAAIFSFYATKNVTCGEGGAVISSDETFMTRLQQTMLHGMSAGADRRFEGELYRHWDMSRLGTKANLPDILASLLPRQIREVEGPLAVRTGLADRYRGALAGIPGLSLLEPVPGCVSAHHLFVIGVPASVRDQVLKMLNQAGVGTTVNYRSVHRLEYYQNKYHHAAGDFPVASDWGDRTLSLPLFPGLTEDEQDYVIETVRQVMAEVMATPDAVAG